jgi:hypothetical protein
LFLCDESSEGLVALPLKFFSQLILYYYSLQLRSLGLESKIVNLALLDVDG